MNTTSLNTPTHLHTSGRVSHNADLTSFPVKIRGGCGGAAAKILRQMVDQHETSNCVGRKSSCTHNVSKQIKTVGLRRAAMAAPIQWSGHYAKSTQLETHLRGSGSARRCTGRRRRRSRSGCPAPTCRCRHYRTTPGRLRPARTPLSRTKAITCN